MSTIDSASSSSTLADTQVEEHINIRSVLARIRAATTADQMAPHIHTLTRILPIHFAHEADPGGVFDTVVSREPTAARHIERFLEQHTGFLRDLDALRAAVESASDDLIALAESFCARLAPHEAEENDVLFDALYVDTGESD